VNEAMLIGRRIINQLRVFNFRHGLNPALEMPSPVTALRHGWSGQRDSEPAPFEWMKKHYFELMGWDPATGKPLPHTLKSLGLEKLIEAF